MSAADHDAINRWYAQLGEALDTNEIVRVGNDLIVPDVMMLEALANGREYPHTPAMVRGSDHRAVYIYQEYELGADR